MPEGDTVYRAARLLARALNGHQLIVSDFRVPQHATADLRGATVTESVSRGKHILTRIQPEGSASLTLHTHLKMEGAWRVFTPTEKWSRPRSQARVILGTSTTTAVGFSLGIVELIPTAAEESVVGHLGPDLLGGDWDEARALTNLGSDPQRPAFEALLDQRNLAGIGNMYAAELCFIAGVHPLTPIAAVPALPRLLRRAKQMLELNKERAIQSTTGNLRVRERMWVYRRDKSLCLRCGTPIAVVNHGPPERLRAAYFCPSCQPMVS